MTNYFIVPGFGNSGPDHWQTFFENSAKNFQRILQNDWDTPNCNSWTANIDRTIAGYDPLTVVLVGHSLGCVTIAHWAGKYDKIIKGAMLVAPSDLEAPQYKFPITGFAPIPLKKIKFKTVVVASSNDQWVTLERAKYFATNWGSEFINIGEAGHINVASGFTEWKEGLEILKKIDW